MPITLDMMEYANDAAAQAAYVSSDIDPVAWDLLDEDCVGIGDWVDNDTGDAVSQVNPPGQFEFDSNTIGNTAERKRDIGAYPNIFTIEIKVYHDALGLKGSTDYFYLECWLGDEYIAIDFATDGLFIRDTDSGSTEIGTNLVKYNGGAEWQTWRFVFTFTGVTGEATCDVYLEDSTHDWEKVGSNIPCSMEGAVTDGITKLIQYGSTTGDRITHVDYIKIATGAYPPSLQCFSEDTEKQQGSYSLKGIAQQTSSLNDYLERTIGSPIDLSDRGTIKFDIRASRTGAHIKVGIRDSGSVWTEKTYTVLASNTWETVTWDISGVSNANKDAIDRIKITILNADAVNTFYLDNMYAQVTTYIITASAGSYSLSGQAMSPLYHRIFSVDAGSYALSGQTASTLYNRLISANVGSYALTGQDVSLIIPLILLLYSKLLDSLSKESAVSDSITLTSAAKRSTILTSARQDSITLISAIKRSLALTSTRGD